MKRRRGQAGQVALQTAVAIVLTWPLVGRLTNEIPLGQEPTPTVPYFNLWTLRWNAQQLAHGYSDYWNAPIFAPSRASFARSEAQPLTGFVFAILRSVCEDVAAYNLITIGFLALNGVAGVAIARRLGATAAPAALAGIVAQSLPFVFNQFGVLQLVCVFPMLFAFERLIAYQRSRKLSAALGIAVWFVVCDLTSGYYAVFLAIALACAVPIMAVGVVPWKQLARDVGACALLTALLLGPYAISQSRHTSDAAWSRQTVTALSMQFGDYRDHAGGSFGLWLWENDANDNGLLESPGTYLTGLGIAGLVIAIRRRQRRLATAVVITAAGALLLSMGFHLSILGWRPYEMIFEHIPGFERLRSPFRFSVVVQVALLVVAPLTLHALWQWRRSLGRALAIAVTVLAVVETGSIGRSATQARGFAQLATTRVPDVATYDWVKFLRRSEAGTVAMVPFAARGSAGHFADTTVAMSAALEHGHPLANGYTGLFPTDFDPLWRAMDDVASRCGVQQLQARGVRYLVIAHDWFTDSSHAELNDLGFARVFEGTSRSVYEDVKRSPYRNEC